MITKSTMGGGANGSPKQFVKNDRKNVKLALIFSMVAVLTFASLAAGFVLQDDDTDVSAVLLTGTCGADLEWSYDSVTMTMTITGTGPMGDYASPSNQPWYNFYQSFYEIRHLIVDGATTIGKNAFRGTDVETVIMSDSVTTIGEYAFGSCSRLTSIEFSSDLTTIVKDAFEGTTALKSVDLPDGLVEIGQNAFYDSGITSITIPSGVRTLGATAFEMCRYLEEVVIEEGLETISAGAFTRCQELRSVVIPSTVTSIGADAFRTCNSLSSIVLPNVATIGQRAFQESSAFESLTIMTPGAVSVGTNAFYGCTSLAEIIVASSSMSMNSNAFRLGGDDNVVVNCDVYAPNISDIVTKMNATKESNTTFTYHNTIPEKKYNLSYEYGGDVPASLEAPADKEQTAGTTVTLPEFPEGYSVSVLVNENAISTNSFPMPGQDTTVTVTFTKMFLLTFMFDESTVYEKIYVMPNTAYVTPAIDPVKEVPGETIYEFIGWNGLPNDGSVVTDDVTLSASFEGTAKKYKITFMNGDFGQTFELEKDETIIAPTILPSKQPTDEFEYTFKEWTGFTEGMLVTGEQTFYADFNPVTRKYYVAFEVDGTPVSEEEIAYGTVIVPPEDPVKEPIADTTFTFIGWVGYTEGMTVSGTHTFQADFKAEGRLYDIIFMYEDGGYEETVKLNYDAVITFPAVLPTKESTPEFEFRLTGWNGYTDGMKVTGDVTFFAVFTPFAREYTITFVSEGSPVKTDVLEYGTTITAPTSDPTKAQTVGETFSFAGWKDFTAGMTVEGNKTFTAEFTPAVRMYTVTFVRVGGNIFEEKSLGYETNVQTPSTSPEYAPSGAFSYEFDGWVDSVTKAVLLTTTKVNGDMTFEPVYKQILNVDANGLDDLTDDDGTIIVEGSDDQLTLSKDALIAIDNNLSSETGANALKVSAGDGTIEFDKTSVGVLKDRETNLNLSIVKVDNSILTDAAKAKAGDRPVYAINVGAISDFNGGVLKITLKYDLQDGEDASKLVIWNLKADGSVESFDCVYDEVAGTVTFETTHLSNYCIAFASADDDGGFPILFVAIAVVAILAVLVVVYFLFIKKKA